MRRFKLTKRGLMAAALAVCAAGPAAADSPPLRIGYVFAMANAPVLIADAQGLFKVQGLQVVLTPFPDGPTIQQAIAAGQIDVAYTGAPPVYQWYAHGLDLRILAKVNYGQATLVARSGGPIHTLADLRGHRIADASRGSGMDVLLRGFVLQDTAKLDPNQDVSLVQMPVGNMNQALSAGVVDAAFEWEPFVSQQVLRGSGRVVFNVNQALPHYPWYVIAATTATIKQRPDDLIKLLRANHAAIAYLNDHPAPSDALIAAAFKLQPETTPDGTVVTPAQIVSAARSRLGWSDELGASDIAFIQRLMNYSFQMGLLPRSLKAQDVIDTDLFTRAVAQP